MERLLNRCPGENRGPEVLNSLDSVFSGDDGTLPSERWTPPGKVFESVYGKGP